MPIDIIMPQMGADMTQGKVLRWRKEIGDEVQAGEIVAEIETDKATIEYEAYDSGTMAEYLVEIGQVVPVQTVIARLAAPGESLPAAGSAPAPQPAATAQPAPAPQPSAEPVPAPEARPENGAPGDQSLIGQGEGGAAGSVGGPFLDSAQVAELSDRGEVSAELEPRDGPRYPGQAAATQPPAPPPPTRAVAAESDGRGRPAPAGDGERVFATPIARRLAEERGIDLRQIRGTGPNGRILKEDIEEYLAEKGGAAVTPGQRADQLGVQAPSPAPPAVPTQTTPAVAPAAPERPVRRAPGGQPPYEEIELNRIRQTAARRTAQSKQTAPHFYITMKVDMSAALALREQLNAVKGLPTKISINDLVIKAAAKALVKHREINASYVDEKLRVYQAVNIGIAVGLAEGLITVVLTDVDRRTVLEIATATKDLYERARAGRLRMEEYSGATFTISNLGMYGVEQFAAVINPPEGAILAVASVLREPVVEGDRIRPGDIMRLTLSADHRVTDGVHAAEFLSDLRGFLEEPASLLL